MLTIRKKMVGISKRKGKIQFKTNKSKNEMLTMKETNDRPNETKTKT